jgi:catalase
MAPVKINNGILLFPHHSLISTSSVCFDSLFIACGKVDANDFLLPKNKKHVLEFVNEAYKHCKAVYFGSGAGNIYILTV